MALARRAAERRGGLAGSGAASGREAVAAERHPLRSQTRNGVCALAGGDYDGDIVAVSFNSTLVHFLDLTEGTVTEHDALATLRRVVQEDIAAAAQEPRAPSEDNILSIRS